MRRVLPCVAALLAATGCFSARPIATDRYSCAAQADCLSGYVCYQGYCCEQDRATGLCVDHPCITNGTDDDKDGFPKCAGDCDDEDPSIHPGATESCNGKDDDCDGVIDNGMPKAVRYVDADHDGHGSNKPEARVEICASAQLGSGFSMTSDDCDDSRPDVYGGHPEVCDQVDNDCNTLIDDGVTTRYFLDSDSDGFGVASTWIDACSMPSGYAAVAGDCDDGDARWNVVRHFPFDQDGDGYGATGSAGPLACSPGPGFALDGGDCDDSDAGTHPNATETCDLSDQDCDGVADEGLPQSTYYSDKDGDFFGDPNAPVLACMQPPNAVTDQTDCDDTCTSCHPGGVEVCDGRDNDCNLVKDDFDPCGSRTDLAETTVGWGARLNSLGAGSVAPQCSIAINAGVNHPLELDPSTHVAGNVSVVTDGGSTDFFFYYPNTLNAAWDLRFEQLHLALKSNNVNWESPALYYATPTVFFCSGTQFARWEPPSNLVGPQWTAFDTAFPNDAGVFGNDAGTWTFSDGGFDFSKVDWIEVHANNSTQVLPTNLWIDDFHFTAP